MVRMIILAGLVGSVASVAMAQDGAAKYRELQQKAQNDRSCSRQEQPDFTMFSCGLTYWYFTKPNHGGHPGVVERKAEQRNGRWVLTTNGYAFGPDSTQPAFKAWLAQFEELNRRMQEDMDRRTR